MHFRNPGIGARVFPGIYEFSRNKGFQPVRAALNFEMTRFANNNASSTGWKPVSRWKFMALSRLPMSSLEKRARPGIGLGGDARVICC
jgi:hypothetical protein